jgi:hypothetical protein
VTDVLCVTTWHNMRIIRCWRARKWFAIPGVNCWQIMAIKAAEQESGWLLAGIGLSWRRSETTCEQEHHARVCSATEARLMSAAEEASWAYSQPVDHDETLTTHSKRTVLKTIFVTILHKIHV